MAKKKNSRTLEWWLIAVLTASVLVVGSTKLLAHDWYEPQCCSGSDCRRVPMEDLAEMDKGCWKYLPTGAVFCGSRVRPSQDRYWHVCINPNNIPYCAYIQNGS